ncbi:arc repressoR-sheeT [Caudoviricetes sp.]|nr:arc repressoR-sheeT [Caudoviricetes sp.]
MEKDLRKAIEKEAKKEHRSLSAQVVKILTDYFIKEKK